MVDDSAVMRSIIERALQDCPDIAVVGKVATTREAFSFLAEQSVDVVLLDHEMPTQKGLDALPAIMEAAKGAHVVMLSSHCQKGSKTAVAALSLGASDALPKPTRAQSSKEFATTLSGRLRRLAASRRVRREAQGRIELRPFPTDFRPECVAIGASTGGIHTLAEFLRAFRRKPLVPLLVTQHLPESFTPYYAQQVARMCDLPVAVAQPGDAFLPGHVYIAPGDGSLSCVRAQNTVRAALVSERDPVTHARPSVNIMFSGLAQSYGASVLGVVLTGMGRDGTAGARDIVEAGGAVIAQDAESSVIWGMPGSVTSAGLACATLHPRDMFDYLSERCGGAL